MMLSKIWIWMLVFLLSETLLGDEIHNIQELNQTLEQVEAAVQLNPPTSCSLLRPEKVKKYNLFPNYSQVGALLQGRSEVIEKMKQMIRDTRRELVLTTFHCDPNSLPVKEIVRELKNLNERISVKKSEYTLPLKIRIVSTWFEMVKKFLFKV